MNAITDLSLTTLGQVWLAFVHNWPFLLISVLVAVALKLFVSTEKLTAYLLKHQKAGVVTATLAAVLTPFCSCGTTAVILGMMASTMPWAPIVAFMVASPLSSPEELIYSAGLFGWPFAITFFVASIVLGLLGGWLAAFFEARGWLKGQSRFTSPAPAMKTTTVAASCGCSAKPREVYKKQQKVYSNILVNAKLQPAGQCCSAAEAENETSLGNIRYTNTCGCSANSETQKSLSQPRPGLKLFFTELWRIGSRLLWMFTVFAFIGYLLNNLIPSSWMQMIFGSQRAYSVPLAATLGLPFYINSEASLPLVRAMMENGMNQGAALAFLISGAGTSIGAISGALMIARWKVIALVVGTLWVGAILAGTVFNLVFPFGII